MTFPLLLRLGFAVVLTSHSFAQTLVQMDWGAGAQNITGDSDVATQGSLFVALNFGVPAVGSNANWDDTNYRTINGVTFTSAAVLSGTTSQQFGGVTLSESPALLQSLEWSTNLASAQPFGSLSSSYQDLVKTGVSTSIGGERTLTLTLSSLTPGNTYLFQWWSNASDADLQATGGTVTSGGLTLNSNLTDAFGGLGQHATGTFTATDATMYLEFNGEGGNPVINAFQLRTLSAIPEPSTYAAWAGSAALVFAVWRRHKRRAGPAVASVAPGTPS